MKNAWDTNKGEKVRRAIVAAVANVDYWRGLAIAWVDQQRKAGVIVGWAIDSDDDCFIWSIILSDGVDRQDNRNTLDSAIVSLVLTVEKARKAKEKKQ